MTKIATAASDSVRAAAARRKCWRLVWRGMAISDTVTTPVYPATTSLRIIKVIFCSHFARSPVRPWWRLPHKSAFVIGAAIHLGYCLDLMTRGPIDLLKPAYDTLVAAHESAGRPLPENKKTTKGPSHALDCAVINTLHVTRAENLPEPLQPFNAAYSMTKDGRKLEGWGNTGPEGLDYRPPLADPALGLTCHRALGPAEADLAKIQVGVVRADVMEDTGDRPHHRLNQPAALRLVPESSGHLRHGPNGRQFLPHRSHHPLRA